MCVSSFLFLSVLFFLVLVRYSCNSTRACVDMCLRQGVSFGVKSRRGNWLGIGEGTGSVLSADGFDLKSLHVMMYMLPLQL